ncbi:MAG: hypothetical protein DDT36_01214 [Firmicutes bacterium]|nr:hypothetical protein [Bacillota bacterium]
MPRWKSMLNSLLDLPQDMVYNLPRLTMVGNRHLVIENYLRILAFDQGGVKLIVTHKRIVAPFVEHITVTYREQDLEEAVATPEQAVAEAKSQADTQLRGLVPARATLVEKITTRSGRLMGKGSW